MAHSEVMGTNVPRQERTQLLVRIQSGCCSPPHRNLATFRGRSGTEREGAIKRRAMEEMLISVSGYPLKLDAIRV